jgi:hypothetical protein
MYRIKEITVTPTYSEFKIERKFLWFWVTVNVPEQYLCSLLEASKWIRLKEKGFNPNKYYYE